MPRLPKGMFMRGSSFYTRVYEKGRDRWISLGPDREEACRRFRAKRREAERDDLCRLTVAQAAEQWLESYIQNTRNKKGRKQAADRVKQFLVPFLGQLLLAKVTREDLRRYRPWLERQGIRKPLSPSTVKHVLSDARCFLNWTENAGLIERSPFPKRIMPRLQERPPDRLTDEEVAKLVGLPEPFGFVIRLGLGTGLRWGELMRARANDLRDGVLIVSQTKTGKVRRVPLVHDRALLAEVSRRVGRLVAFKNQQWLTEYCRRETGIKRFHVHQLRHTFACCWLERGGTLAALQQLLGHASITTTQRYARLSDEFVRAEAERLASA